MIRILVCGDRNWTDKERIKTALLSFKALEEEIVVIEGGCRGADLLARDVALELGMGVEQYDADWDLYGKAAGHIRNLRMVEEGKPTLALAFHPDLSQSKGTKDMLKILRKHGILYTVVNS